MLEFFRKYQRFFFLLVAVLLIASFSFFGTYSTFSEEQKREDLILGQALDGSPLKLSEIQALSRFLATDCNDLLFSKTTIPNLCNDGVIRNDLLRPGVAELFVSAYFEPLKEELQLRVDKVRKFKPYSHPQAPFLNAMAIWEKAAPPLYKDLMELQQKKEADLEVFHLLAHLYHYQSFFPPQSLQQVLLENQNYYEKLPKDPNLQQGDLSLFGFHTLTDWFGKDFVDLASLFIINAAALAEQKGYEVSLEEAKGDLSYNFATTMQTLKKNGAQFDLTFHQHLRMLGFDEKRAAECWCKILLFRRYFQGLSRATFVDRLPYRDFASYATETAIVDLYQLPSALQVKTFDDLIELQVYLTAVSAEKPSLVFPQAFLPLEEVEKKFPELVQTTYRAKVSKVAQEEVDLIASVKDVWNWQLEHWEELRGKFFFVADTATREERFKALENLTPPQKSQINAYARRQLSMKHPEWLSVALEKAKPQVKVLAISADKVPLAHLRDAQKFSSLLANFDADEVKEALLCYTDDGETFYRVQEVERFATKHILTFEEAKKEGLLKTLADRYLRDEYPKIREEAPENFRKGIGEWLPFDEAKEAIASYAFRDLIQTLDKVKRESPFDYASCRLFGALREAYVALQKNPHDPRWIKGEGDPLVEQFKLIQSEQEIQRKEGWMNEQAFVMLPKEWSPIEVGDVSFFYLKEKKNSETPIFEQLNFGMETIAADTQRFLTERLLDLAKERKSIIIPLQREINEPL